MTVAEDPAADDHMAAGVMAAMPDSVVVVGAAAELIWANAAAERRFGWSLDVKRGASMASIVHPDDLDTALLSLDSVVRKEIGTLVEIRLLDHTDRYSWYEIRGSRWEAGPPGAVILDLRESTDRHRWEVGAGDSEMLGSVLDAAPTITMVLEADGRIRSASRALTRILHRALEGALGRPLTEILADGDAEVVRTELELVAGSGTTRHLEARFLTASGEAVPMSLTVVDLMADRAVQGLVAVASDISSLVGARGELHHLANHDDLTGLPNRTSLRERLAAVLTAHPRREHTLLFADVDGLKQINDQHGHRAGDAVLIGVADRLRSVTREGDFVARLSGDEFVMLIPSADPPVIAAVQGRIARVLAQPVTLPDGHKVTVSMSTGTAVTEDSIGVEDLLAAADAAMYIAKRERAGGI